MDVGLAYYLFDQSSSVKYFLRKIEQKLYRKSQTINIVTKITSSFKYKKVKGSDIIKRETCFFI